MRGAAPNRLAVVAAATIIAAGGATAFAVTFPGRVAETAVAASGVEVADPPSAFADSAAEVTPPPAPTPTPSAAAPAVASRPRTFTPVRRSASAGTTATQPRRQSSPPTAGCRGMPGPACEAVTDQPSPRQPPSPD